MQKGSAERLGQIRVRSHLVSLFLILQRVFGSQQDDGNMAGAHVFFQLLTHRDSVHHGHHDIAHNDVGDTTQRLLYSQFAVSGGLHFKIIGEGLDDIVANVLIILHNQQNTLSTGH